MNNIANEYKEGIKTNKLIPYMYTFVLNSNLI